MLLVPRAIVCERETRCRQIQACRRPGSGCGTQGPLSAVTKTVATVLWRICQRRRLNSSPYFNPHRGTALPRGQRNHRPKFEVKLPLSCSPMPPLRVGLFGRDDGHRWSLLGGITGAFPPGAGAAPPSPMTRGR
jgi:hypothetical protein